MPVVDPITPIDIGDNPVVIPLPMKAIVNGTEYIIQSDPNREGGFGESDENGPIFDNYPIYILFTGEEFEPLQVFSPTNAPMTLALYNVLGSDAVWEKVGA